MRFALRSLLVMFALYGLVFAIGDAYLLHGDAPIWWGLVFVVVLIGGQFLAAPWLIEFFYSIGFYEDDIPVVHREFIAQLCRERGLPTPRMGFIYSGTPNAFAYGRFRKDARIVITKGLLDILTPDEVNAVLAHELGHIAHYDFALMAVAAMAPLLLWQLYIWTNRVNNLRIVSYAAYVAYWLGQYMVLLLNRTREYHADHFSAEVTREPGALGSALVKIGYGMVRERSEQQRLTKEGASAEYKRDATKALQFGQSLSLMGIASASGSDAMVLAGNTPEAAARVMRWDLTNPWARFYELSSTHPLTAMRLRALNRQSVQQGMPVPYPLPEDTRVRWAGFPVQLLFWAAPLVCGFLLFTYGWLWRSLSKAGYSLPVHSVPILLTVMGITWAARILFRYHGTFQPKHVTDLLDELDISQMRPRAVELEGEVIGHGVPGAFWSPDLVLQDETGMMFLLYRSSVPFGRLFFAIRSADRLVGERVKVQGWYRRGLKPYVEIARVESTVAKAREGRGMTTLFGGEGAQAPVEYEQIVERSYSRWLQLAAAAVCTTGGLFWLLG